MTYTRMSLRRAARRGKNEKRENRQLRERMNASLDTAMNALIAAEAQAARAVSALVEIKTVTDGIKVPNGTTKKLARIAEAALA